MSSSARGRAGKYNKPSRGGGKKFSRNLTPLDADGNPVSMWSDPQDRKKAADDSDEESSEEESSEESSSEEDTKKGAGDTADMTREERKAAAKKRKEAAIAKKSGKPAAGDLPPSESSSEEEEEEEKGGDMPANPNHTAKARNLAAGAVKPEGSSGAQLSRREREAVQAQQARERYQKLHAEGKTDEARADLARLKLVREKRDADAARKQAEKEEREAAEQRRVDDMDERERKKREAALGSSASADKGGKKKGKK